MERNDPKGPKLGLEVSKYLKLGLEVPQSAPRWGWRSQRDSILAWRAPKRLRFALEAPKCSKIWVGRN